MKTTLKNIGKLLVLLSIVTFSLVLSVATAQAQDSYSISTRELGPYKSNGTSYEVTVSGLDPSFNGTIYIYSPNYDPANPGGDGEFAFPNPRISSDNTFVTTINVITTPESIKSSSWGVGYRTKSGAIGSINTSPYVSPTGQQADDTTTFQGGGIINPVIGNLGGQDKGGVGGIAEAESGGTFVRFFIIIWRALYTVGGLIVIIMFLWGAISWITGGGDAGKVQKARDQITQAVIGLIILVGSFVIIAYISQVAFGDQFDILNLTLPTP